MDRLENMDFNDRTNQSSREIYIHFASYSGSENLSTRFLKSFDCFFFPNRTISETWHKLAQRRVY